jgi:hypothetical protein
LSASSPKEVMPAPPRQGDEHVTHPDVPSGAVVTGRRRHRRPEFQSVHVDITVKPMLHR